MAFEVRHAVVDDGPDLLELWHGFTDHLSTYDERYDHKESADDRWLGYFESQLVDSKYGTVVVAEDGDDLVGVLEARVMGNHPIFRLENHGYVNGLFVRDGYPDGEVGRAMLDAARDWFASPPREVGFCRADVIEGDERMAGLYRSAGFEPVEHVYERRIA